MHPCKVMYDDLPQELRALIWKKRTELRKDAATIIFRNLVRNLITRDFKNFLESALYYQKDRLEGPQEDYPFDINYISAYADHYLDRQRTFGSDTIAGLEFNGELTLYENSFVTDIRNILLRDWYGKNFGNHSEDGEVDLTDAICEAREEFKARP